MLAFLWRAQAFSSCSVRASHGSGFPRCRARALGRLGLVVVAYGLGCSSACRILVPDQGLNPCPLHYKAGSLTTGPPGQSCILPLILMRKVSLHLWPLLNRPGNMRDQKNTKQIFFQQFGSGLITYLHPTWKAEGATSGAALCKENQKRVCSPRKQTQAETREGGGGRKYGSCWGPGTCSL